MKQEINSDYSKISKRTEKKWFFGNFSSIVDKVLSFNKEEKIEISFDDFNKDINPENLDLTQEQKELVDILLEVNNTFLKKNNVNKRWVYVYWWSWCGKTTIVDNFYAICSTEKKIRLHFQDFITELIRLSSRYQIDDIADVFAHKVRLFCFDEFELDNIAEAHFVKRMLQEFAERWIITIATSNFVLNSWNTNLTTPLDHVRSELSKFMEWKQDVIDLWERDFRAEKIASNSEEDCSYYTWVESSEILKKKYKELSQWESLFIEYDELCKKNASIYDYRNMFQDKDSLFIKGIAQLWLDQINEAQRLKNIIDLVYERNINIYISSEYTLDNIFDDLVIKHIKLHRTISRLKEMVTKGYREDTGKERRRVFIRDSLELLTEIDTELKENKIKK